MQITDCTLCLLPGSYEQESLVELNMLFTSLPITIEYPEKMESTFKDNGVLRKNNKVMSCLPPKIDFLIPYFGKNIKKHNEILFPSNDLGLAGAIACGEVLAGGRVRTSFGGLNNMAATEEVLVAAYVLERGQQIEQLKILPKIAVLLQKLTGMGIPLHKPIIGENIFMVESGIHVDGILKNPELYEPFPPEIVGQNRRIVLGSHSGRVSIKEKLREFNIACDEKTVDLLLQYVKAEGKRLKRHLTDAEFLSIVGRKYGKQS